MKVEMEKDVFFFNEERNNDQNKEERREMSGLGKKNIFFSPKHQQLKL